MIIGKLDKSRMRQSSDSVWPLRDINGLTWAERKRNQEKASRSEKELY